MDQQTLHCPDCAAPLDVPLGETEVVCPFCASKLRLIPGASELEVVKTREEMKFKERVEVQKLILQKQLDQEEADRWRQTAAQVAIASLPVVGTVVGRTLFHAALGRRGGCLGCGCLLAASSALLAAGLLLWP